MHLEQHLEKLKANNLFRQRMTRTSQAGRYVSIEGRKMLNFNSNDYLGLANHPEVLAAASDAASKFGFGATGSPLMSGYTSIHQELEFAMAAFLGYPRVVLFSAGYLANLGVAQALLKRKDWFIQDRLNHAIEEPCKVLQQARQSSDAENWLSIQTRSRIQCIDALRVIE